MVIFDNIFAEGDFSEWTSTIGTPAVQSSEVYTGNNAMETNATAEYAVKTFTEQTTVYCRAYFKLSAVPPNNGYVTSLGIYKGSTVIGQMHHRVSSGGTQYIRCRGSYPTQTDYTHNVTYGTDWHYLEIKFIYGSGTSGEYRFYYDGVEISAGMTARDTSGISGVDSLWVGSVLTGYAHSDYVDAVAVDTSYLGEYVAPSGVTQGILVQFM